ASEIDRFVGRGYYRLEMIQTVLLAERSRTTLGLLDERREKGESLRDIAQSLSVDFDALYEEALRLEREVEARVRSLLRIDAVRPGKSP
ncbi:MAG: hypothetical protein AAB576_08020, partial [Elusimicrobiota bacterium]